MIRKNTAEGGGGLYFSGLEIQGFLNENQFEENEANFGKQVGSEAYQIKLIM